QVIQGPRSRGTWDAAQGWCRSRRLRTAIRKPASTSKLPAIPGALQEFSFSFAQIDGQLIDRADEVRDGVGKHISAVGAGVGAQALSNNIGLGDLSASRLGLDLSCEGVGQPHGEGPHGRIVIRY